MRKKRVPKPPQGAVAIVVGFVVLLALTAAAPGPDASRAELMAYSLGCAVALVVAIKIVIKLFVYILQAVVVVAAFLTLFSLVKVTVNAIAGA